MDWDNSCSQARDTGQAETPKDLSYPETAENSRVAGLRASALIWVKG
jgi:hypothetical protein